MIYFVWLGSKRAKKQGVEQPGVLLDEATGVGLPVPAGAILLDRFYHLCLEHGLAVEADNRLIIPDPLALSRVLYEEIRLPRLSRPVTITPIARPPASPAVLAQEPTALVAALEQAWFAMAANSRHDILIIEQIESENRGIVYSQAAYQDDLVFVGEEKISLPQLQSWEPSTVGLPPFAGRLQKLLRGLRRTFGAGNWLVEWADDGQICWLVGLRPGSPPVPRQDHFISLADLWPALPLPLVSHIIANSPDFGRPYLLPGRNISQFANGQRLLNQSLSHDNRRRWGLPTGDNFSWQRGRLIRHLPQHLRLGLSHQLAIWRIKHLKQLKTLTDYANFLPTLSTALSTSWLLGQWPAASNQPLQTLYDWLLERAGRAVAAGQLPTAASLWLLSPTEMSELDSGRVYSAHFLAQRQI